MTYRHKGGALFYLTNGEIYCALGALLYIAFGLVLLLRMLPAKPTYLSAGRSWNELGDEQLPDDSDPYNACRAMGRDCPYVYSPIIGISDSGVLDGDDFPKSASHQQCRCGDGSFVGSYGMLCVDHRHSGRGTALIEMNSADDGGPELTFRNLNFRGECP